MQVPLWGALYLPLQTMVSKGLFNLKLRQVTCGFLPFSAALNMHAAVRCQLRKWQLVVAHMLRHFLLVRKETRSRACGRTSQLLFISLRTR